MSAHIITFVTLLIQKKDTQKKSCVQRGSSTVSGHDLKNVGSLFFSSPPATEEFESKRCDGTARILLGPSNMLSAILNFETTLECAKLLVPRQGTHDNSLLVSPEIHYNC
jgi:hypothetical protein